MERIMTLALYATQISGLIQVLNAFNTFPAVAGAVNWTDCPSPLHSSRACATASRSASNTQIAIIVLATLVGTALDFTPIDAMNALHWSAVINGVVAVPIMAGLMLLASKKDVMAPFTFGRRTRWFGWLGTGVMMGWDWVW